MTAAVEATARAVLGARLDRGSTAPLAVAVSGGGDSMTLMHLAADWAREAGRPLLVLTIDHGLQSVSAEWAAFVETAASRLGLECRVLSWTGPKPTSGLPAAARSARHALLADAAREVGARVVLLGHTADDIAESAWMRERGCTLGRLRPWSPSPAWPEGRGVMLLRPLLDLPRAELRAWLTARGVGWLEDPANIDFRFARARARAALASGPHSADGQPRCTDRGRSGAPSSLVFSQSANAPGVLTADRGELLAAPGAGAVLGAALLCVSGQSRPPRGDAVAALLRRLAEPSNLDATLAGARLRASSGSVLLFRESGRRGLAHQPVSAGRKVVWDGRFEVTPEASGVLRPAGGVAARLTALDGARLRSAATPCRATLPVLETQDGAVRLLPVRALAGDRLRAALGGYASERELP